MLIYLTVSLIPMTSLLHHIHYMHAIDIKGFLYSGCSQMRVVGTAPRTKTTFGYFSRRPLDYQLLWFYLDTFAVLCRQVFGARRAECRLRVFVFLARKLDESAVSRRAVDHCFGLCFLRQHIDLLEWLELRAGRRTQRGGGGVKCELSAGLSIPELVLLLSTTH